MPTYEYLCQECGHKFERFQSMMEDPIKQCPACAGKVKRLISSGAGIIFKGSGFYITDYKKKETAIQGPVGKEKPADSTKKDSSAKSTDSNKGEKGNNE